MKQGIVALVLAAGQGTRFKSERIKVLHKIMGKSMLQLVVDCVQKLKPEKIYIVVGYQKNEVIREISSPYVNFIFQQHQLGTAHAVLASRKFLKTEKEKDVLIINGDLPVIAPETLKSLLTFHRREGNCMTFMSAELDNPEGFGRLIRCENNVIRIIEEKDATPAQKKIKRINVGVYVCRIEDLLQALPKISNQNKKGEYYLTDVVEVISLQDKKTGVYKTSRPEEVLGINTRLEMAKAAELLRDRKIKALTDDGVTIYDPKNTWIDLDVRIGMDTIIYSSVIVEGNTRIGNSCQLFPFVHLINSRVGNRVKIFSSTFIEESIIEDDAKVGPFAHLRPKTVIRSGAKVGNFVEMKNTTFGPRSKAGHLTYLGDCEVEQDVNIGAGTISCNYDGFKKYKTYIEAGAFIGSGTELVAPLRIGKKAYIGAGSTITKDVKAEALAVERATQVEKPGWTKRKKKK
ncbi:MAG: bifunctional UDP-N-acetylglucosamine diphosphorylase/glucosamine-1-phosphate N-acetyltransferase GlmU [Candidatus Aminicenantaceae bacterium]